MIVEQSDGFLVGGTLFLKKAEGWTRAMVDQAVDNAPALCNLDREKLESYDEGFEDGHESGGGIE